MPSGSGPNPEPAGAFSVTTYGADPTGQRDSTTAIEQAISAAQAAGPGHVVYFPAGTYDDDAPVKISEAVSLTLLGYDRATTSLVDTSSSNSQLLAISADHITVDSLTFNSSRVSNGHSVVASSASYTTVEHCGVQGGPGTSWPLRFAGGADAHASPTHPVYATGNTVDDLILYDDAPQRNDGFDFSFQEDATITDVVHTGSRLGLYVDRDITVTDYHFTPNPLVKGGAYGYYITTPGTGITIDGFVTSGDGGVIGQVPKSDPGRQRSSSITIEDEDMTTTGYALMVGDVIGLTIKSSHLTGLKVDPTIGIQGITVIASSLGATSCGGTGPSHIEGMVGFACPA